MLICYYTFVAVIAYTNSGQAYLQVSVIYSIQIKEEQVMAKSTVLKIEVRNEVSKKENKRLQSNGYIIGVINQKGMDSIPVAVKSDEFRRVLKENGRNAIFKLQDSDKNSYDAMVKTIEISPMKYEYYHIDFQKVSLTEEVKVDVSLSFVGRDFLKAKRLILNRQMDSILVNGLPHDIPDSIEIDVTDKESGNSIFVGDLVLGKGISTDLDKDQLIASISEAKIAAPDTDEAEDEDLVVVSSEVELGTE